MAAAIGESAAPIAVRTLIRLRPALRPDIPYIAIDSTGPLMTAAETE